MFKLIRDAGCGALGISLSAVAAGLAVCMAWHGFDWGWDALQPFLLAASIPWAMVFVGLLWLTWRRLWVGFEQLLPIGDMLADIGPEEIRIIPFQGRGKLIEGVDPDDLRFFIETVMATGDWTQRAWRGVRLPSGRKCDNDYWAMLTAILRKTGILVDAGPRSKGRLTTTDATRVLDLLGLNGGDVN